MILQACMCVSVGSDMGNMGCSYEVSLISSKSFFAPFYFSHIEMTIMDMTMVFFFFYNNKIH